MENNSLNEDTPVSKISDKMIGSNTSMQFSQSDDVKLSPGHMKEEETTPIQKIGRF